MIAIRDLFESHLTVSNLDRSVQFYRDVLGLPLAHIVPERRVAFFWIGAPGKAMLGVWETGAGPQRMTHHMAFKAAIDDVLASPNVLRESGITPLNFASQPTDEPVVLWWMPAVASYLFDPVGNLLDFLAMIPQPTRPAL